MCGHDSIGSAVNTRDKGGGVSGGHATGVRHGCVHCWYPCEHCWCYPCQMLLPLLSLPLLLLPRTLLLLKSRSSLRQCLELPTAQSAAVASPPSAVPPFTSFGHSEANPSSAGRLDDATTTTTAVSGILPPSTFRGRQERGAADWRSSTAFCIPWR